MSNDLNLSRVINLLRKALEFTEEEVSDEDLLKATEGTLTRSLVDIELAKEDFGIAMKAAVMKSFPVMRRWLQ